MTNYEQYASEEHLEPISIHFNNGPQEHYEQKTAGFWMRFWAFALDSLIVLAIIGLLVRPVFYVTGWEMDSFTWYAPYAISSAIVYYSYFVVMTYYFGQTIGKMIFGLRVVSVDGVKPSFMDILFREWIGRFICNSFMLLYFVVVFLDKHQGLHDYFADTMVVQEDVFVKVTKQLNTV